MKLPSLFRRNSDTGLVARSAQDQAEKLLVESFRMLAQVASKMADFVEAQRLERAGYETQGKYLERLDGRNSRTGDPAKEP
ncbi:MAG: hypothetical protein ACT4TC_06455 [Myxococcaceae bacterium]